jgi:pimeloyl-ACP methyl ester carboxylesterase
MSPADGVRALSPFIYDASTPDARIDADLAVRLRSYPTQESYDRQLEAIQNWTSYGRLADIRTPTLVLHGEHDRLIPPDNGRVLASSIAGARYRQIRDASHIFTSDKPEETVELIQQFLAENS